MKWMLVCGCALAGAELLVACSGGPAGPVPAPSPSGLITAVFENKSALTLPSAGGTLTMPAVGIVGATMLFQPPGAALGVQAVTANGPVVKDPGPDVWSGCPYPFQTEVLTFAANASFPSSPAVSLQGVLQPSATWFQYELFDADAPAGTATIASATVAPGSNPEVVSFPASAAPWKVAANHRYVFTYISSASALLPCSKVYP